MFKGNTIQRTTIIDDLQNTPDVVYCIHYFDFRDNTGNKSGYRGFLLNMLQQVTDLQGIHSALDELYSQCKRGQQVHQPSNLELKNTLNVIFQQLTPGWIVLDAMDECNTEDKLYILKWLEGISAKMSIVITSRYFPEGQAANTARIIGLESGESRVEEDISIFLEKQLQSHFKGDLKDQVLDILKAKAQGQ